VIPLFLSSCRLLSAITSDRDCGFDHRGAIARGTVTEGTIDMAYGDIGVWDYRGAENRRSVGWNILAFDVGEHVTSVRLVTSTPGASPLLVIPFVSEGRHFSIAGSLIQESGEATPALEGLLEPVTNSQTAFEITTDLPDRPVITIPLTLETSQDWLRATDCY
jgi:hypothetical protein